MATNRAVSLRSLSGVPLWLSKASTIYTGSGRSSVALQNIRCMPETLSNTVSISRAVITVLPSLNTRI